MDTTRDQAGRVPEGWALPREEANLIYGNPVVTELLESLPSNSIVRTFRTWVESHDRSSVPYWGLPDFEAAQFQLGMSSERMAETLGISEEDLELLELGIAVPTIAGLFRMSLRLNVPAGVFFRDQNGWHRRTALGRRVGYPGSKESHFVTAGYCGCGECNGEIADETNLLGWDDVIVDPFDNVGNRDE